MYTLKTNITTTTIQLTGLMYTFKTNITTKIQLTGLADRGLCHRVTIQTRKMKVGIFEYLSIFENLSIFEYLIFLKV